MAWSLGLKSSTYPLEIFGFTIPCYAALSALVLNIVVGLVVSMVLNAVSKAPRYDETVPSDYLD
jgi:SSS family solute:Na+ symporter